MIIIFPVSEESNSDSSVYTDFGTAPAFYWHNVTTGESGCVSNDGCEEEDGGKSSVDCAAELGAEAVIANEVGCAAVNRLRGKGADTYASAGGSIAKDIEKFKSNSLRRIFAGECDGSCKV